MTLFRSAFSWMRSSTLRAAAAAAALCSFAACAPAGAQPGGAASPADLKAAAAEAQERAAAHPGKAPAGERVFVCGHSFHTFVAEPLVKLADEAKIVGHVSSGVQFLGNSRPMQHWELPAGQNLVKKALVGGQVDVLTLAPHSIMPEPAVDLFADLALKHNPQTRVLLQLSWAPFDGRLMNQGAFKNADRDRATAADLALAQGIGEVYLELMRGQVREINKRYGRDVAFIVPVGTALMNLRGKLVAGEAPGFAKQSELFSDPMGHGAQPLKDLAAYCWFAAIYRQSPVGLAALSPAKDETSRKRRRLLQEIAWEAVLAEPCSGVSKEEPKAAVDAPRKASEAQAGK